MSEREPPAIERYSFGSISVGGTSYTSDLIVLPDRIVADLLSYRALIMPSLRTIES